MISNMALSFEVNNQPLGGKLATLLEEAAIHFNLNSDVLGFAFTAYRAPA